MDSLEKLFNTKIMWQEKESGGAEFYAIVEGEHCELRINDFPEEPLYTLICKGLYVDFDDTPDAWEIP